MSLVIFLINLLKSDNSISEFLLSKKIIKSISEVKFRSLSKCIKDLGANYYFARGNKILRIIDLINANKTFKTSLGGCIIKKTNNTVIINKEFS